MPKQGPIVRDAPVRRPGRRRQHFMVVLIVLILGGLLAVSYFIFAPSEERYVLASYAYADVVRGAIEETLQLSGTLVIEATENVLSPQPGVVAAVYVEEGDDVIAGQVVAEISPKDLKESLEQKRRSLDRLILDHEKRLADRELDVEEYDATREELESQLAENTQELEATRRLESAGAASKQDLEQAAKAVTQAEQALATQRRKERSAELSHEYAVEVYRLDRAVLEEEIADLEEQIEECVITSPLAGKVMDAFVDGGDIVTQYGKVLRVADLSRPIATIAVPENKTSRLYPDQPVTLTLAGVSYPGEVVSIAMEAEDSGDYESTVKVDVEFRETPERVVPGSTVSAEIVLGSLSDTLYLPRGQFLTTGNERYLFRVAGDRAIRVEAVFGVTTAEKVEILSGVSAGDRIITSGYQDYLAYEEIELNSAGGRPVTIKEQ